MLRQSRKNYGPVVQMLATNNIIPTINYDNNYGSENQNLMIERQMTHINYQVCLEKLQMNLLKSKL